MNIQAKKCLLALLAAGLLAGCSNPATSSGGKKRVPEVVTIAVLPQRVVLTAELVGRTSAFRKAEVRPQVDGILLKRLFTEGGEVREGQALYKIDPARYEAALESARAALAKAQANLEPSRLRAERYRELLGIKAVSKQEFDDAEASFRQAQAEVAVCRAAVKTAEIHLAYTDVRAPVSGRIGKSAVTPGALVTANQTLPLARIQQLDKMYVDVTQSSLEMLNLRERFADGRLERGDNERAVVRLRLENDKIYPHQGMLQFTDVTVDESTGAVGLRAIFPNPDLLLLPGMYVRAILNEGVDENALLVPQLAVMRDPKGQASVFVLKNDGSVELRPVQTGGMVNRYWQITGGLAPLERVVVEGFQNLRHGMKVKARPSTDNTSGSAAPSSFTKNPQQGK